MNEQTLYEYITENYGFTNDAQELVVSVYEDKTCQKLSFTVRGTSHQILKHFTFYYLNMVYVVTETKSALGPISVNVYQI